MLTTILRGKGGRLTLPGSDESISWRAIFVGNEDLLTGVLFGRMRYLSPTALQRVMALLIGSAYADGLGELTSLECWPRLDGLPGRRWVEPDVLLEFEHARMLVEVKPPLGPRQSIQQWRAEIEALVADGDTNGGQLPNVLHFLALGQTDRREGEVDRRIVGGSTGVNLHVHCREWLPFRGALEGLLDQCSGGDAAVIEDWLEAFRLFGIEDPLPQTWGELVSWMEQRTLSTDHPWQAFDQPSLSRSATMHVSQSSARTPS